MLGLALFVAVLAVGVVPLLVRVARVRAARRRPMAERLTAVLVGPGGRSTRGDVLCSLLEPARLARRRG